MPRRMTSWLFLSQNPTPTPRSWPRPPRSSSIVPLPIGPKAGPKAGPKTGPCRRLKKSHCHVRRAVLAPRSTCCATLACGYRRIAGRVRPNPCANPQPPRRRLPCRFLCHAGLLLPPIEARHQQRATPGWAVRSRTRTAMIQMRERRGANGTGAIASKHTDGATPPWEEMPLDDYQPVSSEEGYFMPPDDGFMPAFDSGPDDLRFNDAPAAKPAPRVDARPLPAAVPLDAIGVSGDWPTLAVDLPLKGIAYQLAFNSELTGCDDTSITLVVPVPQYAESAQVAKLKAALTDKLGRPIDVNVNVGPARRTAAAVDAAVRAQRQQEAEQEITQNPFVQSLIRDFGASIVQGSIKPLASALVPINAQDGGQNAAPAS